MEKTEVLMSVIVCTYNRAKLLGNCLKSIESQTAGKNLYEVIVVNNNSTDNTQKIIEDFVRNRPNFRVIIEKNQGLSYARNKGWKEAKGKYIAYIDDDAIAEPNWVEQIVMFIKNNPKINVFGGPYGRFSLKPFPKWFPEEYGILNLGDKIRKINPKKEWLTGTNMIFRKVLFKKYGGFKTCLGMRGTKMYYGEETEMIVRLSKKGEFIYYVPTIRVKHLVAEYKFSLWWLLKSDYFHNLNSSLISGKVPNLLRSFILFLVSILVFPVYLLNIKKEPFKRKIYYGLSNVFSHLGKLTESFNLTLKK